jgi:hypothetical protein
VRNVSHAVLSECTLALNKVPVPISFDSCGTVVVRDSTFSRNDASTVGAISATNVASLTLADSSFVYNSGSLAHVLNASNTNVGLSGCTFVSNGGLLSTDHDLIAITGGSLSMAGSQVRLNWGATIALRNLTAASNVTGSTFELNFNARQRSLIDVDGCTDVFTLSRSTISYNLGTSPTALSMFFVLYDHMVFALSWRATWCCCGLTHSLYNGRRRTGGAEV